MMSSTRVSGRRCGRADTWSSQAFFAVAWMELSFDVELIGVSLAGERPESTEGHLDLPPSSATSVRYPL